MGIDPTTSALNRYLQNREASNLFVMGGAAFPQNPGHNLTCTIGALTYWSAQAITSQYLKARGRLFPPSIIPGCVQTTAGSPTWRPGPFTLTFLAAR